MNSLAGKRIAISLGASFMGYATHAGFLAEIARQGLRPIAIGGSSAGAIAAGLFAAGLSPETIREAVIGTTLPLSFIRRTRWLVYQLRQIVSRRQPGFFDARGAAAYFESLVGQRQIEELHAPRLLVALTDLKASEALFVQSGPLARAMAASSLVPLIFSDLEWQGRRVCDGGVAHEAPIDPWFHDPDIDTIVIHRVHQPAGPPPWFLPLRLIHTLAASHHCTNTQWLADRRALARLHGKELIVLESTVAAPSIFSRASREACYAAGEAAARAFLS